MGTFGLVWVPLLSLLLWQPDAVPSVSGTIWAGRDSAGREYTFRFQDGGKVSYTTTEGTFSNGTWTQTGEKLVWELNNKFWVYTGKLNGETLNGTAVDKNGRKKGFNFKKQPGDAGGGAMPAATKPASPDLAGTVWHGTGKDGKRLVLRFQAEGKLEISFDRAAPEAGQWKLDGDKLTLDINQQFAEYQGTVKDGAISGSAKNVTGEKWDWQVKKGEPPAEPAPTKPAPPATKSAPTMAETKPAVGTKPAPQPTMEATKPTPTPTMAATKLVEPPAMTKPITPLPFPSAPVEPPLMTKPAETKPLETKPAPMPVATKPSPPPEAPSGLVGSYWRGRDSDGQAWEIEFKENGEGRMWRGSIETRNVRWRLDGDQLAIEINGGFSKYAGQVRGNSCEGSASNVQGKGWTWSMTRMTSKLDLTGTTWSGQDSDKEDFSFVFLPDGQADFIRYKGPPKQRTSETRKAVWRIENDNVVIEVNRFSTYTGLVEGNVMKGTAANAKGHRWTWRVIRQNK